MKNITNDFLKFAHTNFIIDLHEFHNSQEALEFMEKELYSAYQNRQDFVRVIHGIGSGIMKNKVIEALQNNPLIKEFSLEESGGSTIIKL
ncbi:MAG: Smr/MutS family protein [Candidatus Magasanikbacteria bacterium]